MISPIGTIAWICIEVSMNDASILMKNKTKKTAKFVGESPWLIFTISYLSLQKNVHVVIAAFRNLNSTLCIDVCTRVQLKRGPNEAGKKSLSFLSMHKLKLKPKLRVN